MAERLAGNALDRLAAKRSASLLRLKAHLQRDGLVRQPVEAAKPPWLQIGDRWVLNFTSTDYLGLGNHPWVIQAAQQAAQQWGMALSMPSYLVQNFLTRRLSIAIARLVGQEKALIFPSTTHIALDLLPLLAGKHGTLFLDEWAYPISQEGAALAAHQGARLVTFPHNEGQALAAALQSTASRGERVIVCDGVYSTDGHPAALRSFLRAAGEFGALIYVDDAHGVGILGTRPRPGRPYGSGGGGICAYLGLSAGRIVHVGSLSKAFGVPLAFVAGPAAFIDYLEANAGTFIHSSPPDLPSLAAALAALQVHARRGEQLRARLAQRIARLQAGLHQQGINLAPNHLFPIQTLVFASPEDARTSGVALRRLGFLPALQFHPRDHPQRAVLRIILTARHSIKDVDALVEAIGSQEAAIIQPNG
jgi:8-amino-7-oxononanoate synthase